MNEELLSQLLPQAKACSTHSGQPVWWLEPERTKILAEDIYVHQSRMRRYMGAVDCTGLTHAMLCGLLADHFDLEPAVKRYACAHDLVEAYLPDLPGQLKRMLPWYSAIEDLWQPVVHDHFGLEWPPPPDVQEQVKNIDKLAPLIEIWLLNGPEYLAKLTERRPSLAQITLGRRAIISPKGQWSYIMKAIRGF